MLKPTALPLLPLPELHSFALGHTDAGFETDAYTAIMSTQQMCVALGEGCPLAFRSTVDP
jgi:hypothetical protein